MRIIGGKFKGKKLILPIDNKTRPLRDIVKESIFNLITHSKKIKTNMACSYVLDLFSGSGSFGIECISRDAKKVFFCENYCLALKILKKNLSSLKEVNNYQIFEENCLSFFFTNKKLNYKFNIIFIDPPFNEMKINQILNLIIEKNILDNNGLIILHRHKNDKIEITKNLDIIETKIYGTSKIIFLKNFKNLSKSS